MIPLGTIRHALVKVGGDEEEEGEEKDVENICSEIEE